MAPCQQKDWLLWPCHSEIRVITHHLCRLGAEMLLARGFTRNILGSSNGCSVWTTLQLEKQVPIFPHTLRFAPRRTSQSFPMGGCRRLGFTIDFLTKHAKTNRKFNRYVPRLNHTQSIIDGEYLSCQGKYMNILIHWSRQMESIFYF